MNTEHNKPKKWEAPKVSLVGAGPGDVGLLTLRGKHLLEQADVVVYDYLSNPALLRFCKPGCDKIYAGKKAAHHSMTQDDINALLVRLGQEGKRVVRLKGGDPYVFGRGGEEGEALHGAGVAFEVVPGITSAIGGIAFAGIPVTHRDFNSSFTLITGHEKEDDYKEAEAKTRKPGTGSSDVDWGALARLPCVAFYMGAKALPRIVEKLTEAGLSPDTPAATVQWASTARQKTATGTLATIVQKVKEAGIGAPAISIIGRVVTMRPVLNWFESRPLFGKTVVVTRTRQQASDLTVLLEEQGAQVIEAPTIDIGPPGDWKDVDAALRQITSFDWLLFTSPSGVKHAHQRMRDIGLDGRSLGKVKIGVVGESTAKAVSELFFRTADAAPDSPSGEGLARHLHSMGEVEGRRFLSLRADIARPTLVEKLTQYGCAELKDVSVYETRPADALPEELLTALKAKTVDWITFTSSSTATNFIKLLGADQRDLLDGVGLASIGPQTTQTVIELGLKVTAEAKDASLQALVDCLD